MGNPMVYTWGIYNRLNFLGIRWNLCRISMLHFLASLFTDLPYVQFGLIIVYNQIAWIQGIAKEDEYQNF